MNFKIIHIERGSVGLVAPSIPVTRSKKHFDFWLLHFDFYTADVAQLVEQCSRKAWVAGSSPAIGSKINKSLSVYTKAFKIQIKIILINLKYPLSF